MFNKLDTPGVDSRGGCISLAVNDTVQQRLANLTQRLSYGSGCFSHARVEEITDCSHRCADQKPFFKFLRLMARGFNLKVLMSHFESVLCNGDENLELFMKFQMTWSPTLHSMN